jgi:hypothetical protein
MFCSELRELLMDNDLLLNEIKDGVNKHRFLARLDSVLCQGFFWIAVAASITASFLGLTTDAPKFVVSIITLVPVAVLFIENTFKYGARSDWHWLYERKLIALERKLRDQGATADEVSKLLSRIDAEMYDSFPTPGPPGGFSGSSGKGSP